MNKQDVKDLSIAFENGARAAFPNGGAIGAVSADEYVEAQIAGMRALLEKDHARIVTEAELAPALICMADFTEKVVAALRKRAVRCRLRMVGPDEGAPASSSPPPSEACPACGIEGGHSPAVPCGVEPKAGG